MEGPAFRAVVHMVRAMRDNGCRIDFICLTGTMLSDDDASALASALNSLEDRDAAPASCAATLASQECQDIPRIAETCSAPGAGGDPAEPVRWQPDMNTLHLILPSHSLPLLNGPAHVWIASSLVTMRVRSKQAAPAAAPGAGRWKLRKKEFH